MALPKVNRLKSKKDFDSVFKKGNAVRGNFLFIKTQKNNNSFPRFGLVVPAKIIPGAVARNRIKRLWAETVKKSMNKWTGYDVVVVLQKKGEENNLVLELSELLAK